MTLIQGISQMFSYSFLTRALLVGGLVSLCAALLGVTLVLKRLSMIGDGLSHVGFGALSVSMALGWAPMAAAVPVVLLSAVLLLRLSERSRLKGDAAVAIFSSSALALGVIVTALSRGMGTDVYGYMFGSVLSMSRGDVYLSLAISAVVLVLFALFYNRIFAVTFDEGFARATGSNVGLYKTLIACLTALTIVVGMRIMGTLLISSLIIFPALSSMRMFYGFRRVVLSSAVISVVCFFVGMTASYLLSIPAGASIVAANTLVFGLFTLTGALLKR